MQGKKNLLTFFCTLSQYSTIQPRLLATRNPPAPARKNTRPVVKERGPMHYILHMYRPLSDMPASDLKPEADSHGDGPRFKV